MTERRLTILQLNDLHGYLEPHPEAFRGRGKFDYRTCGGLARIATIFTQVRAERPGQVLALDNGDTFHGTFVAGQARGEAMLPLMNALAFDAMTLHWEFAYGPAQVRKLAAGLGYPALAINIYDQASGQLVFAPSCVIERGGLRIGIVGIASDNVLLDAIAAAAGTRLAFSNGWRYGAPILPGNVTMEHLWNIVPTHPPISTVELTGEELRSMLEANLERTYSPDPYCQMGGFVKRCRGLNLYFKMENPKGQRIEDLLVDGAPIRPDRTYRAAMLGEQGVPKKYGRNRQRIELDAIESLQRWFARGRQVRGGRRGSVVAI